MFENKNHIFSWEDNIITRKEETVIGQPMFQDYNKIVLVGTIIEPLQYDHENIRGRVCRTRMDMKRLSGVSDSIVVKLPEDLLDSDISSKIVGKRMEACGMIKTKGYNGEDGKRHMELYVFTTNVNTSENSVAEADQDLVYLEGELFKDPVYRKTYNGRMITDLFVSPRRDNQKKSYITCLAWNKLATEAAKLCIGDRIALYGRLQSREYFKRVAPDSEEGTFKTAYEVSIMQMRRM